MSSWKESIKVDIAGEDGEDHELEIETDSDKNAYIYFNSGDDKTNKEYLGSMTLESLIDVCNRAKVLWEEEAKKEDK